MGTSTRAVPAPRTVAIVGGGIAGLTLAAALDPRRFTVRVIEAEPGRRVAGSALGIWPAAQRVLDRIGADVAGVSTGGVSDAPPPAGSLFDLGGERLLSLRGPDLRLVERPALMAALAGAVPDDVEVVADTVTDPSALDADLVVGADGVRSRVRALVHPPAADRVQTPYVALRGIVDRAGDTPGEVAVDGAGDGFRDTDVGEYWGAGRLFGLAPLGDGRAYWFTTHRSELGPEPLDVDAVLDEARASFADAAQVVRRVLAGADRATIATRLWLTPPVPRYARGRYVVVGDAAHASLPNLGRGACDAMLDAASLAATLNRGGSLARWQVARAPVTQAARLAASGIMRLALLDHGRAARNSVLRRLGALSRAGAPGPRARQRG